MGKVQIRYKTIPAQATTVTTSLPEGTMILDEEYDSQVNVTGFVAFDSFTAGTDGYFTIPSDYEDFHHTLIKMLQKLFLEGICD